MNVQMHSVGSSNIKALGWFDHALYIDFLSGRSYKYPGVPQEVFEDMLASDSVGKFFHNRIRPHYDAEEVSQAPTA